VLRSSHPLKDTGLRDCNERLQGNLEEGGVLRKAVASCPTLSSIYSFASPTSGVNKKLGRVAVGKG
jgi:hypothetical protein